MTQNAAQTVTIDAATLLQLSIVASQLIALVQAIHSQSAQNTPEVWAQVKQDYDNAVSLWGAVSGKALNNGSATP